MSKLHEILAVDGDLQNTSKAIANETIGTFSKKPNLFLGRSKTLTMFDEDRRNEEAAQAEYIPLATTVQDKLDYTAEHLIRYFDVLASKEATNQQANDGVKLDGKLLFDFGMPATLLLGLENRLAQVRKIYEAIPNLDPSIKWEGDNSFFPNGWRSADKEVRPKTEKSTRYAVMAEATKEHKAQVDKVTMDRPVGQYETTFFSGMITSAEKSNMLHRIDKLIQAIKQARQRANDQEVVVMDVGKKIFDYIHGVSK